MRQSAPNRVIARSEATWQSQGTDGREISGERYFPEIATASSKPRNDNAVDDLRAWTPISSVIARRP